MPRFILPATRPKALIEISDHHSLTLLAVSQHGNSSIRLCETSTLTPIPIHYATLSHCWGDFVPLRLLKENMPALLEEVPLNVLWHGKQLYAFPAGTYPPISSDAALATGPRTAQKSTKARLEQGL